MPNESGPDFTVIVIGAGPGGICAAVELERRGITDFTVLEKAPEPGGTWWHNRYPGAECDVQSHLYSFTFAPKPDWSRPYAGQQEILTYVQETARQQGVLKYCRFRTEVTAAHWRHAPAHWEVRYTDPNGAQRTLTARFLISAIGMFNDIALPVIPGLDQFAGARFHTARWPDDHNLSNERVAVIGSAASAVQTVPEIAPLVRHLYVCQRTPQWILPKSDKPFSDEELARYRRNPDRVAQRRDELYAALNAAILFDDPEMLADAEAQGLRNLEAVEDPALRQRMTPTMRYGCRRPLLSNTYYPAFNRPNVTLVDKPIERITPAGFVVANRWRRLDTIVLATGFETTRFLTSIDVTGRDGRHLRETWDDGAQAYLGSTVSGYPNLFMLYGPNTNNGSLLLMLELEAAYAVRHIQRALSHGIDWLDVKEEALARYNERLQRDIADIRVWGADCRGYYRAESGRVVTQLPYDMDQWRLLTTRQDVGAYETGYAQRSA